MKHAGLFLIALVILASHSLRAIEPFQLRYNLTNNQSFTYRVQTIQHITHYFSGKEIQTTQKYSINYAFKVINIANDGTYTITVTFDTFSFELDAGEEKLVYNSEDPSTHTNPETVYMKGMIGFSFTIQLSPLGKLDIVDGASLIPNLIARMNIENEDTKLLLKESLENLYSADHMKEALSVFFVEYPEKKITLGHSWQLSQTKSKDFPLQSQTGFSVKEITEKTAIVNMSSLLSTPKNSSTKMSETETIQYELQGTQSGPLTIGLATGLVQNALLQQKLFGTVTMDNSSIKVSMNMTTTVDLYNDEPTIKKQQE